MAPHRRLLLVTAGLSLLLLPPAEASAWSDRPFDDHHLGWMGFFGGPTIQKDDEPILWRLSLRGAVGVRIGASPVAIDGGLAMDGAYSSQTGALDSRTSQRNLEIAPFGRVVLLIHDSVSLYLGAGLGYVQTRTTVVFPIVGDTTHDMSGNVFRLMGGIEAVMGGELRLFLEPLGLNAYSYENLERTIYSVLFGLAAVF